MTSYLSPHTTEYRPIHSPNSCRECFLYTRHAQQSILCSGFVEGAQDWPTSTKSIPGLRGQDVSYDAETIASEMLLHFTNQLHSLNDALDVAKRQAVRYHDEINLLHDAHHQEVLFLQEELRKAHESYRSLAEAHAIVIGELEKVRDDIATSNRSANYNDESRGAIPEQADDDSGDDWSIEDEFEVYQQLRMIHDAEWEFDNDLYDGVRVPSPDLEYSLGFDFSASKEPPGQGNSACESRPRSPWANQADAILLTGGPASGISASPLARLPEVISIYVDACARGIGFVLGSSSLSWRFKDPKTNTRIPRGRTNQVDQTWAELLGVEIGLETVVSAAERENRALDIVYLYSDNRGIVTFLAEVCTSLRLQNRTRSSGGALRTKNYLTEVIDRIITLCRAKQVQLIIRWVSTLHNLADKPSRGSSFGFTSFHSPPNLFHLTDIVELSS